MWDFCEAFFKVSEFEDILTQYEAEFTTKKIFRDKNGSLLYRYAFVTLFDSESKDLLEFNNNVHNLRIRVHGQTGYVPIYFEYISVIPDYMERHFL